MGISVSGIFFCKFSEMIPGRDPTRAWAQRADRAGGIHVRADPSDEAEVYGLIRILKRGFFKKKMGAKK